jgi:hypothetical protein
MGNNKDKPFSTLQGCLDTLRREIPSDRETLYRGEAVVYPHSYSLIYRLTTEQQVLPLTEIRYLVETLDEMQTRLNIVLNEIPVYPSAEEALRNAHRIKSPHPIEIMGAFLQHYYLPTPLLDLTDDLEIAAKFAAYPADSEGGGLGCIYAIDVTQIIQHGWVVYSLKQSKADRPRHQCAHSLLLKAGEDIQDETRFPRKLVDKYYFTSTDTERAKFFDPNLMKVHGDLAAREVGRCCAQIVGRDWQQSNSDQKKILRFYDDVCGRLAMDEAPLH